MSSPYEIDYCLNCGEDLAYCDCTQQQQDAAESAAEARGMSRWEESMEEYNEDEINYES